MTGGQKMQSALINAGLGLGAEGVAAGAGAIGRRFMPKTAAATEMSRAVTPRNIMEARLGKGRSGADAIADDTQKQINQTERRYDALLQLARQYGRNTADLDRHSRRILDRVL
jgi:hypothetical protein